MARKLVLRNVGLGSKVVSQQTQAFLAPITCSMSEGTPRAGKNMRSFWQAYYTHVTLCTTTH